MDKKASWIAVDFDGTLCEHHGWTAWNVFGPPIPAMVERVKLWRSRGKDVRIFTARVFPYIHGVEEYNPGKYVTIQQCVLTGEVFTLDQMVKAIQDWTQEHIGERLPCTCAKDYAAIELWDDRAVQVIPNTGKTLADEFESMMTALRGEAQGS